MSDREDLDQPILDEDVPRRVDLSVARVDPWSVMKVGFLLSVALGIALVFATLVLWLMLDSMHVFGDIEEFLKNLSAERFVTLMEYLHLSKVLSYATIAAVANVIMITAMSTLGAFLYNIIASLVGGVRVSLMDEWRRERWKMATVVSVNVIDVTRLSFCCRTDARVR